MDFPEPGDHPASRDNRGIEEVLQVLERLRKAGIPGFIVGGRALIYYGVNLSPEAWHVCVPDDRLDEATAMFDADIDTYKRGKTSMLQIKSLIHTYPHFKQIGVNFFFRLIPHFEYDIHDFTTDMIEHSRNGIPYLKLQTFAQSLVSTQHSLDLERLIDGMDLTEEWGYQNLKLGHRTAAEIAYAREKNRRMKESAPPGVLWEVASLSEGDCDRTEEWQQSVRTKRKRVRRGDEDTHVTEYRLRNSEDPRLAWWV